MRGSFGLFSSLSLSLGISTRGCNLAKSTSPWNKMLLFRVNFFFSLFNESVEILFDEEEIDFDLFKLGLLRSFMFLFVALFTIN